MKIIKQILLMILFMDVSLIHANPVFESSYYPFEVENIAEGLYHPWGMAFLPDGSILVTERHGRLRMIKEGKLLTESVKGLPDIHEVGQGGLLDIVLHPQFETNQLVYFSYTGKGDDGYGTEVARGQLNDLSLKNVEVIFRAMPKSDGGRHFGSRLLFTPEGKLLISLGDRGDRPRAQDLKDHAGSLIRINDDGSIPDDNPFINSKHVKHEIYTYGNRNMQGMTMDKTTGEIWTNEHGPQGGDELNLVKPGNNYGWPVITYGKNYVIGTDIGEGTHKQGMEQPVHYWVPSIGPSGMTFYDNEEFPKWKNNLFISSLIFGQIVRLKLENKKVVEEERLVNGALGRIRDIQQGPDGKLYFLTDDKNGLLARINKVH